MLILCKWFIKKSKYSSQMKTGLSYYWLVKLKNLCWILFTHLTQLGRIHIFDCQKFNSFSHMYVRPSVHTCLVTCQKPPPPVCIFCSTSVCFGSWCVRIHIPSCHEGSTLERWKKDSLSSSAQKIKFFSPVLFNLPNNNSNNNPLLLAASLLCSSVSMATAKLTTQSGADEDSRRGCRQSCSGAHLRTRRCHRRAERLCVLSSLCYSVFLGGFDWSTFAQILQSCAPSLLCSALNLLWFWECRSADWSQCESALNISSFSGQKGMSPLLATTPLVSL